MRNRLFKAVTPRLLSNQRKLGLENYFYVNKERSFGAKKTAGQGNCREAAGFESIGRGIQGG